MTHPSRFVLVAVLASLLAGPALAQAKKKAPQQPPPVAAAAAPVAPTTTPSGLPLIETQAQFAYITD
ncbi:MAG: FKBP-type peptidyl-prolyl cis-trans isomerase, partial [Alphaproteobacteria bacterium]|nr:FKBP-type peptidyl-prolyl cis-trans isomerase [Alphaproteobacteria bacterium]